jgi:hypothetical protein
MGPEHFDPGGIGRAVVRGVLDHVFFIYRVLTRVRAFRALVARADTVPHLGHWHNAPAGAA